MTAKLGNSPPVLGERKIVTTCEYAAPAGSEPPFDGYIGVWDDSLKAWAKPAGPTTDDLNKQLAGMLELRSWDDYAARWPEMARGERWVSYKP